MSFESLLKTEFTTKRLTDIADTSKSDYQEYLTAQAGMLQPYGDLEEIGSQKIGKIFKLFCQQIDLKESDRILLEEVEYTVQSIKNFDYGAFPHMEVLLAKL